MSLIDPIYFISCFSIVIILCVIKIAWLYVDLYKINNKYDILFIDHQKNLRKLNSRPQSVELREFLADLAVGESLVSVHRIDPNSLFTHSPRDI